LRYRWLIGLLSIGFLIVFGVYSARGQSGVLRPSLYNLRFLYHDYIGKKVVIRGYARLVWFFDCGYEDEEESYFSVQLKENPKDVTPYVYIMFFRPKHKELLELLQGNSFKYLIEVEAVMLKERYEKDSSDCWVYTGEGLSWRKIK